MSAAHIILPGTAAGPVIATDEPISFWGGIDPANATIMDAHHPLHGQCLTGAVLVMPTTRGSCTGSGVLLDMALNGRAPAALIFSEPEDVVTLGALVAAEMFDRPIPVLRCPPDLHATLARASRILITADTLVADGQPLPLAPLPAPEPALTDSDRAMLGGAEGRAVQQAMRILCRMARLQGAKRLVLVTQGHIDGCIYASPANLTFAEAMADLGACVRIPTTMNAISVDHRNCRAQGVPALFGDPAQRLADACVRTGRRPGFTCAPYLLDSAPARDEPIGWAESNAVIYANSVLGARTHRHPDFLDLCIAMTGRAPLAGVYLDRHRAARRIVDVALPEGIDDAFWPLLGYLAGQASPARIPLIRGVAAARPTPENLKALCAAFGTSSAASMLHVEGVTPEADRIHPEADHRSISAAEMRRGWQSLNDGPEAVDLVAIGSPMPRPGNAGRWRWTGRSAFPPSSPQAAP